MAGIISNLLGLLTFAIIARVIMDMLIVGGIMRYDGPLRPFRDALIRITEPILGPIRRYARIGMLDLSPMAAIIILSVIQGALAG